MKSRDTNANDLAQRIGVRASTIYSLIQRDSNRIDINLIVKIARALGVDTDELLNGSVDTEADVPHNDTHVVSNFGANLRSARSSLGLSQKEVANIVGVANSTYSLYEAGKREPNLQTIKKLANVLEVSSDWLLGLPEDKGILMGLEKISEQKKKLNMTTEELSVKSGVPVGTLNKILSGATKNPKFETLKAIAKVLGLTLNDYDDIEPQTISSHFDVTDFTPEEMAEIKKYADYVRSKRKE